MTPSSGPGRASCCSPARRRSTKCGGCSHREARLASLAEIGERWPGEHRSLLWHVLGLTMTMCGIGIAASGIVGWLSGGPDVAVLSELGAVVTVVGVLLWKWTSLPRQIRILDVFITVTVAWVLLTVVGALPYVLTGTITALDDAMFESISGFTTTGATVMRPIEGNGAGVMMWRAITQFVGGMGVIVLVVAVLPTVGSGGMSLLEAEGPARRGSD